MPVPWDEWRAWARNGQLPLRDDVLYLSLGEPNLWWDIVPLEATVYVRYLQVRRYQIPP